MPKLQPRFDFDAWYVNLDSRPDRHKHMLQELDRVGLAAQRQRGYLPDEYPGPADRVAAMRARTPGAIGCFFAQREIVARAAAAGRDTLVLEDDVVFCDDFAERWRQIREFLETRVWDIFWLGATFHVNPPVWHREDLGRDVATTSDPRILRTYGIWSTYAWVVNGARAQDLLGRLDAHTTGSWGIDHLLIQLQPQLKCYCYVPGSVKQRDDRSNIGLNRDGSPGFTRFSDFARLGPYWWQPQAHLFDPTQFDWAEAHDA